MTDTDTDSVDPHPPPGPAPAPGPETGSAPGSTPSRSLGRRGAVANLGAQGGALLAVSVASLLVARFGGAAVLGEYALLRVLPWLTGVVVSLGLPVASTYFIAGERGADPRLRPTLTALAVVGCALGALAWTALTPLLWRLFFSSVPLRLVLAMAVTVATQLITVWGKACCQGAADMRGANLIILMEELLFLPVYVMALAFGLDGIRAVAVGMVGGGVCAAAVAMGRLGWGGFFRDRQRPSRAIATQVSGYGARGQLGNLLWLVNLRLDFLILGALAGPAVLGVYAVASKFAELMRLPATAANYVLYPRFAAAQPSEAAAEAKWLLPRAAGLTVLATPLLAITSAVVLPLAYGASFHAAVVPSCVLLVGLSVEGAAAVASAYLWGCGRPGANSVGMGIGVGVTVVLDVLLIPRYGALGAAITSSAAYLVSTTVLVVLAHRIIRSRTNPTALPRHARPLTLMRSPFGRST